MKNNYFIKNSKRHLIAFLVLFFGLFANTANAQKIFIWDGSTSSDWATADNWTVTGTGSTSTYPGEDLVTNTDQVVIDNGSALINAPVISATVPNSIDNLTIRNSVSPAPILTINNGATLTVTSAANNPVVLNGGNILNNGILDIKTTISGVIANGISCGNPASAPGSAAIYGYSGSGELKIDISAADTANSSAISITGLNTNTTYRFLFNGTTNIKLANAAVATHAVRAAGAYVGIQEPAKVIVGGTGFTLGSVGTPVSGGLFDIIGGNNVTVDTGTTLTLHSAAANVTNGINVTNALVSSTIAASFTNKGTINILGTTTRSGLYLSPSSIVSTPVPVINFENQNIINIDIIATGVNFAALQVANVGTNNTPGTLNIINTTGAAMTLKNNQPQTSAGLGCAIRIFTNTNTANVNLINNGVLNFSGNNDNFGGQIRTNITNNATINSNYNFTNSTITNNETGIFNFSKPTATFIVASSVAATAGDTYTDAAGNSFTVLNTKVGGTGTGLLVIRENSVAAITPGTANLTRTSGTGDTPINYTSVASPISALAAATTNKGTINTGRGVESCGRLFGVTPTGATSVIAPGGATGKGIVDFARVTGISLTGKTVLQISGNTTAGVDYDKIINSLAGTLTVGGALDITGIYTPAGSVTIEIVKAAATGSLAGAFGSVIGIYTGWSVVTTTGVGGKIELVYNPSPTVTTTTWTGAGLTTGWNLATNWNNGVPNQNSNVIIGNATDQPSVFTNVSIKSLTIDAGSTLTLNATYNLTVKEAITNNGSITIQNNANLIQIDDVANVGSGTTTVNRNSNALSRLDYSLWSSPVTNLSQFLTTFSPATTTTRFYTYNETSNLYNAIADPASTPFSSATGYLIRMPNTAVTAPATQTFAGVFTGVPNNGTITKAITYNGTAPFGYNAIGNPYPSTIDANAFIAANTANIESSLYFWRKTNAASGSAYAIYNPLGGTAATPTSAVPNGTIQVGQGFFVKAKSASNITFTNSMRVANNVNQFFKTKQVVQKDRLWLNLSRPASKIVTETGTIDIPEAFSQALVGYTADATTGVDMYDAKYINDSKTAITSSINEEEFSIQGRPAFDPSDVVALNFKNDADAVYTIALDHFDGVFATGQDIYLLDSKTGTETDLKTSSYTFAATAGVDNARFSLKYQKTLKVDAQSFDENSISVYATNGTLYVNSRSTTINNVTVYDVQGRIIAQKGNVKSTTAVINNLRANNQVLIVKIEGEDNSVVTKKLLN